MPGTSKDQGTEESPEHRSAPEPDFQSGSSDFAPTPPEEERPYDDPDAETFSIDEPEDWLADDEGVFDETPPKGWFGRTRDRVRNAWYKAGASASVGGGEKGDKTRKAMRYLPVGIAAVSAAGAAFAGASLLDGGDSHSFHFIGADHDFKAHLGVNGEDHHLHSLAGSVPNGGETADPSASSAIDQSPQHNLEHFKVEAGHGDTHEIQDYATKHGINISDEKSYELYKELHKKFPNQDIVSLLDHDGSDSYSYTNPDTGITEQRISAPSNNATFGSQKIQDFVDHHLGLSPDQPLTDATPAADTNLTTNNTDTSTHSLGVDVESHSQGPVISSEQHSSNLSTGDKLLIAGTAGVAGGAAYQMHRNRRQEQDEVAEPDLPENSEEDNEANNESADTHLEERIALLEQELVRQKEFYEGHINDLVRTLNDLKNRSVEEKPKESDKEEKSASSKKGKNYKKKARKAKKNARKEKTKRKVAEATLGVERRARAEAEAQATIERERTRADLLTGN